MLSSVAPSGQNWNSPLIISPHDHKRLYYGAERLFRSDDRGTSWVPVSGDLSRDIDRILELLDRMGQEVKSDLSVLDGGTADLTVTATAAQLRKAYYRQALRYHPDKVPGKEAEFQAISVAYTSLTLNLSSDTV